jgi:hypothetical protein
MNGGTYRVFVGRSAKRDSSESVAGAGNPESSEALQDNRPNEVFDRWLDEWKLNNEEGI